MTRRCATIYAMASVGLVSSAQRGMGWSMTRLPSPAQLFHETFMVSKTVGVTLIVAGVLTINLRRIHNPPLQDFSHENQRFR